MAGKQPQRSSWQEAKRKREAEEDDKRLTLHLLLEAFIGSPLTVECLDGRVAKGCLASVDDQMKCAANTPSSNPLASVSFADTTSPCSSSFFFHSLVLVDATLQAPPPPTFRSSQPQPAHHNAPPLDPRLRQPSLQPPSHASLQALPHPLPHPPPTMSQASPQSTPLPQASSWPSQQSQQHASLRLAGADVQYVHLPEDADAPELLQSRLRAIDQGRTQFRQRVRKAVVPLPAERHTPLISGHVTETRAEESL